MRTTRAIALGSLVLAVGMTACEGLLDVEDSGTIGDADLRNVASAPLWANAALLAVQESWDAGLMLLSPVSDELFQRGPHGWWVPLDEGDLSDPQNSALERAYKPIASGRWMADEAIEVLDSLQRAGGAVGDSILARAYLYGAIAYSVVPDVFEDYAPSDRTVSGPPIGAQNMGSLYDQAIEYATIGLTWAPGGTLRRDLLASRARAAHAKAVWQRVRPTPADVSGGGLVSAAMAAQDARSALALDPSDWRYQFLFSQEASLSSQLASEICGAIRNLRFGDRYAALDSTTLEPDSVTLLDLLDGVSDPWVSRVVLQDVANPDCVFPTLTVFSAREMHLIAAEDALSLADTIMFATHANAVRAAEGLTAWSNTSGVDARDLLIHERQTQLFLTGRRLADMYRFGIQSDTWRVGSESSTQPGTLFPIPASELNANCYLNGSCG